MSCWPSQIWNSANYLVKKWLPFLRTLNQLTFGRKGELYKAIIYVNKCLDLPLWKTCFTVIQTRGFLCQQNINFLYPRQELNCLKSVAHSGAKSVAHSGAKSWNTFCLQRLKLQKPCLKGRWQNFCLTGQLSTMGGVYVHSFLMSKDCLSLQLVHVYGMWYNALLVPSLLL